jgi:hypothetical protein
MGSNTSNDDYVYIRVIGGMDSFTYRYKKDELKEFIDHYKPEKVYNGYNGEFIYRIDEHIFEKPSPYLFLIDTGKRCFSDKDGKLICFEDMKNDKGEYTNMPGLMRMAAFGMI